LHLPENPAGERPLADPGRIVPTCADSHVGTIRKSRWACGPRLSEGPLGGKRMKINHRIPLNGNDPFWKYIQLLGLPIDRGNIRYSQTGDGTDLIWVLNVTEDNPVWPKVEHLLAEHRILTQVNNIFTEAEMNSAEWFLVSALGHHGYPQPEDDFGYIDVTYESGSCCPVCRIGKVQVAPFRLRTEPKASHSQFLQLNWVFDELFVRATAREGLISAGITGIKFLAPVLHKRNTPSEQIVQIKIQTILVDALDTTGFQPVTCKSMNEEWRPNKWITPDKESNRPFCGRIKYHSMHRGPYRFAREAFIGVPDLVKSTEWFGSGGGAFRRIIASQRFRQVVTEAKWRGLRFEPIEIINEHT